MRKSAKRPRFVVPFANNPALQTEGSSSSGILTYRDAKPKQELLQSNTPVTIADPPKRPVKDILKLIWGEDTDNAKLNESSVHTKQGFSSVQEVQNVLQSFSDSNMVQKNCDPINAYKTLDIISSSVRVHKDFIEKQRTDVAISNFGAERNSFTCESKLETSTHKNADFATCGIADSTTNSFHNDKLQGQEKSLKYLSNVQENAEAIDCGSTKERENFLTSEEILKMNSHGKELQLSQNATYFSVVWCKRSMKKHKKWEGDAVLIIQNRSAVLKDLDRKEIARGMGYKVKEVADLEEGSTFFVGGKECEIQNQISKDDFMSGKCFHSQEQQQQAPVATPL